MTYYNKRDFPTYDREARSRFYEQRRAAIRRYKRRRLRLLYIPLAFVLILNAKPNSEPSKPIEVVASLDNDQQETLRRQAPKLKDGIYRASGRGFSGEIQVEMHIENSKIEAVYIYDHNENTTTARLPLSKIPYEITDSQSVNVDIISGATATSNGIIEAARDCIRQAGGNPSDF